jgi:hypothetical protein
MIARDAMKSELECAKAEFDMLIEQAAELAGDPRGAPNGLRRPFDRERTALLDAWPRSGLTRSMTAYDPQAGFRHLVPTPPPHSGRDIGPIIRVHTPPLVVAKD